VRNAAVGFGALLLGKSAEGGRVAAGAARHHALEDLEEAAGAAEGSGDADEALEAAVDRGGSEGLGLDTVLPPGRTSSGDGGDGEELEDVEATEGAEAEGADGAVLTQGVSGSRRAGAGGTVDGARLELARDLDRARTAANRTRRGPRHVGWSFCARPGGQGDDGNDGMGSIVSMRQVERST